MTRTPVDPFAKLADLSLELRQVDAEIRQATSRRADLEADIRKWAAVVARNGDEDVEEDADEPFADLQPRQLQLLWLLKANPSWTTGRFAEEMYGEDSETTRRSVSAYFSRLKTAGYVIAVGRGEFRLTESGSNAADTYEEGE